jgi:hypothetical protein
MAKRRSREQIDADQIIKKHLNDLGEKVYNQAAETSRRDRTTSRRTELQGTT